MDTPRSLPGTFTRTRISVSWTTTSSHERWELLIGSRAYVPAGATAIGRIRAGEGGEKRDFHQTRAHQEDSRYASSSGWTAQAVIPVQVHAPIDPHLYDLL